VNGIDLTRRDKINTYITTSIVVCAVSYFVVDRFMLRAAQLANNSMSTEYNPRSLIYATIITVAYSVIFWIFIRDIFPKNESEI